MRRALALRGRAPVAQGGESQSLDAWIDGELGKIPVLRLDPLDAVFQLPGLVNRSGALMEFSK